MHIEPAVIEALKTASPEMQERYANLLARYDLARARRLQWCEQNQGTGKMIPFHLTAEEFQAHIKILAMESDLTGQPFMASLNFLSPPTAPENTGESPEKAR